MFAFGIFLMTGAMVFSEGSSFLVTQPPSGSTRTHTWPDRGMPLFVVADAEKEEVRNNNREDDSFQKGEWTRTSDGGFLPNLRFLKRQSKPATTTKIMEINGIQEYKQEVVEEKDQMVCVRFHAKWCRSCKAIGPAFRRLPHDYPEIKFVEVPVTSDNAYLHQGLGIPSLPYAHLYHPEVGLVEERKIGKNNFKSFRDDILKSYQDGFCMLEEEDE